MEVNARLHVEHTVTAPSSSGLLWVTCSPTSDSARTKPTPIQCRVTNEDPARGYKPDTRRLEVRELIICNIRCGV